MTTQDERTAVEFEQSHTHFRRGVNRFLMVWGPKNDPQMMFELQRDLMMLMQMAMATRHRGMVHGVEYYASAMWERRATQPLLHTIMNPSKETKP